MTKHVTLYQSDENGEIIKTESWQDTDEIPTVECEVVNEGHENQSGFFDSIFSFLFSRRKPYNDNGREYSGVTGNMEYTSSANGNANPTQCSYEAPQDSQGSAPMWDGYGSNS